MICSARGQDGDGKEVTEMLKMRKVELCKLFCAYKVSKVPFSTHEKIENRPSNVVYSWLISGSILDLRSKGAGNRQTKGSPSTCLYPLWA